MAIYLKVQISSKKFYQIKQSVEKNLIKKTISTKNLIKKNNQYKKFYQKNNQ